MSTIWEWPRAHRGLMQSQFYLQPTNLIATSALSGQSTPYGPQFQRFVAKLTLPGKFGPDWRELSGFITRLRGTKDKVRLVDYFRMFTGFDQAARGTATTNWSDNTTWSDGRGWADGLLPPFVAVDVAADRGDNSIVLRDLPINLKDVLRMGDLFELRPGGVPADYGMLHEVTRNCRTDADGKTLVEFEPALRSGIAAGDQVVLRYPASVFRLATDSEGVMNRTLGSVGNLGLSLVEVLP